MKVIENIKIALQFHYQIAGHIYGGELLGTNPITTKRI